jgi:hypothetical protein
MAVNNTPKTNTARGSTAAKSGKVGKPGPNAAKGGRKPEGKDMDGGAVSPTDSRRGQAKLGKAKTKTKSTGPTTNQKKTSTLRKK